MSAEVVKKRGRPKKVISDPIEIDLPDMKKSTTRAKSTKAAPKPVKPVPIATKKASIATNSSKPAASPTLVAKVASKPPLPSSPPSTKTESKAPTPAPSKPTSKPPVTPETSKILEKVRQLPAKTVPAPADPAKASKPSPTTISSEASAQTSKATSTPPTTSPPSPTALPASKNPISPPKPAQIPPAASKPPPKIPIAALNSEIVSNIASRAGARPNTGSSGNLPPNYRPVARKVTMAIVAMPILIVTSYVLYERLVLGQDRKFLVKPGLTKVEAPGEDTKMESLSKS